MVDRTAIMVAVHQGKYWREDAQAHMTDYEYKDWLLKHRDAPRSIIRQDGYIATLTKARKLHWCAVDGMPIHKGTHYYSIVIGGGGLGSLKHPDRVCYECVYKFFKRRKNNNG